MARPRREVRDGKLFCPGHSGWTSPTQFKRRLRQTPHGPVWDYDRLCKLCQQTERVKAKREDIEALARDIVENRAGDLAKKIRLGGLKDFGRHQVLCADFEGCERCQGRQLGWYLLVPLVAGFIQRHCVSCAHDFDGRRDVTLDHIHAWKDITDLPLHHARFIRILCGSCNTSKHGADDESWGRGEYEKQQAAYQRAREEVPVRRCGCIGDQVCLYEMDEAS